MSNLKKDKSSLAESFSIGYWQAEKKM